jgi:hypothetical protein
MKKYLMMGMAAVAFASVLSSCSSEDSVEQKSPIEINKLNYELAFVNKFGTPDKNHTWGFGTKTRTVDVNSNEWAAKGYNIPSAITQREKEVVMEYFRTTPNPESETVDLHNYFVQNVGYSDAVYTAKDNTGHPVTIKNPGQNYMNWIFCGPGNQPADWNNPDAGYVQYTWQDGDEHINNFNAGSGQIQHILYSGSDYFGFNDSYGTDHEAGKSEHKYGTVNRNFVIRFIDVDGEVGCYVGFNYESGKTNEEGWHIDPDAYFSDRVIKLVPGEGDNKKEYEDRIMCEDLGSVGDFDFNDVVFDVRYENGNAYVKLINIGGKLPLYVAGQEVHELMGAQAGADGNYPILGNVRNKSTEFEVAGVTSAADISIKVDGSILVKGENVTQSEAGAQLIELQAIKGQVPQKICVAPTVEPSAERVPISETYVKFPEWVQNENAEWN